MLLGTSDSANSNIQNCAEKSKNKITYLQNPLKSEYDKKEYRVIQLPNGLKALLIEDFSTTETTDDGTASSQKSIDEEESEEEDESNDESEECDDEDGNEIDMEDSHSMNDNEKECNMSKNKKEEKRAACAMCVGVGSFSDPIEIQGLAHFLEHMVFMGSTKYPMENGFDAFIKKWGGSNNAVTDCEQTVFHFEIQEKHLQSALDRFAQFFISPLMSKDAISREREAVESEFQMAIPSDYYRKEQLFCSFAKPNHPANKFTWGNLITLKDNIKDDDYLYTKLHEFRERHYSAHRMTLAVQARLPLDTLEQFVIECFSDIPSNNLPADDFTLTEYHGYESFNTPSFTKMYKIKPVKATCQVELTWVMPPQHKLYKNKPHQYVSWIIGHEGKGSLISYLRKKMWCLDIFSGNGESGLEHSSMYALFSLCLILTDEGHLHLKEVLDAVFSYLAMVQREGPQIRIFNEIKNIEDTLFKFADEISPEDNVENLCECMPFYEPYDYLTGSCLYFEYDPQAIKSCLDALYPERTNIIINDKKFDDTNFNLIEPWFQTKYLQCDIPEAWINDWKNIKPLPEFHLPEPNQYITTDFSIISRSENISKYPWKILCNDLLEVWYRPDTKFNLPECQMKFYLITPLATESPHTFVILDLYVKILKHLLVEELYPAVAAELKYFIYVQEKGIIINLNGFNQNLPLLLNTIIKGMADLPNLVREDLFNVMKIELLKLFYNTFSKPSKLAKDVRLSILKLKHWTAIDRHSALLDVDFKMFLNTVKTITDHLYIQCLVQGNVTQEVVLENIEKCVKLLNCKPLLPNTRPEIQVNKIPMLEKCCRVQNLNPTDANSIVTNYYQSDPLSIKLSVIIEFISAIMEEPLFNQLRTQEQLGYNVFCEMRDTYNILGYSITVATQADKYTTEHVDERIEAFVESFITTLNTMPQEEFDDFKESLLKWKQCADIQLQYEVSRNWTEIIKDTYMFDRRDQEISTIKGITINDVKEWLISHTRGGSNYKKISVQVVGTAPNAVHEEETNDDTISGKDLSVNPNLLNIKHHLKHLPFNSVQEFTKESDYCIMDIEQFKSRLESFPCISSTHI